ncbi:histidine phosphatase family protein [Alteribacter keqinensis]|uniref:Histidine phosphatase family protein n=1 Tax=Alteribacter keqinensis TaxID=2483800 RepID=A0A3M7TXY4_9BACI|nr:histidine phosphatase family protein [Alteribacter keqinensis]RNA69295.1 histidine phosphatase family protein [Alteribacter keqinensis]
MTKIIYLIRHCEAEGQWPNAELTKKGTKQAEQLKKYFTYRNLDKIITSPWKRAVNTAKPLSLLKNKPIHTDERLQERKLSSKDMPDWFEKLKNTFIDHDLTFDGGESSRTAQQRGLEAIKSIVNGNGDRFAVVTHGNLLSLILHYYDRKIGFEDWKALRNPDLFVLTFDQERITLKHEGDV